MPKDKDRRHDMGIGGACICPKCDKEFSHQRGVPCQDERCPDCGAKLLRKDSHHYELLMKKRASKEADS